MEHLEDSLPYICALRLIVLGRSFSAYMASLPCVGELLPKHFFIEHLHPVQQRQRLLLVVHVLLTACLNIIKYSTKSGAYIHRNRPHYFLFYYTGITSFSILETAVAVKRRVRTCWSQKKNRVDAARNMLCVVGIACRSTIFSSL